MRMGKSITIALGSAMVMGLAAHSAMATVSEREAARLGQDLTPMGSERAGNREGTIPAWTGGLPQRDVNVAAGEGYGNPYANDNIRFTINGDNLDRYRDRLTPGQIALFETYPDTYKMDVYPTRRSVAFPERVYEWARRNAVNGNLNGTDDISGVAVAWPFPIPQNGAQVIWNHKNNYAPEGVRYFYNQGIVTEGGNTSLVRIVQELRYIYSQEGMTVERMERDNVQFYFIQSILSPARLAGSVLLVHETVNQVRDPRQAWVYNPGQRRVRRAPNVGHDNPGTGSDGLRTNDQNNMFNGSLERYDWELVGKREMYLPYNGYELSSPDHSVSDILKRGHINQDLARYELRRVWVVDATVKDGLRHLYPRRTFYVDEDSWRILAVDVYDNRGSLWRVQEGHAMPLYDVQIVGYGLEVIYDLASRRYMALGVNNDEGIGAWPDYNYNQPESYFSPANLRRVGTR